MYYIFEMPSILIENVEIPYFCHYDQVHFILQTSQLQALVVYQTEVDTMIWQIELKWDQSWQLRIVKKLLLKKMEKLWFDICTWKDEVKTRKIFISDARLVNVSKSVSLMSNP